MEANRGLEPRLVEVDNLGDLTSDPIPYSIAWWLKKILEASGGTVGIPIDIRSSGFININPNTYTDLVTYYLSSGETVNLGEVMLTLKGFSAEFIVEYNNGSSNQTIRQYVLNVQLPSFMETIDNNIPLPYVGVGSYIKVKAKTHSVNQDGQAYVVLNGYK